MTTTKEAPPEASNGTADEEADSDAITIESISDLERTIEEIGDIRNDLAIKEKKKAVEVRKTARRWNPQIERRQEKIEQRKKAVIEYARTNRDELLDQYGEGKTVKLITGDISFRAGKDKVKYTDSKEEIIKRLKSQGHENLVVVRETLHKSTLAKHRDICEAIEGLEYVEGEESISVSPH